MPLIMNASSQEQQVRVHGAWFTFKSKQIKDMSDTKAAFLTSNCRYLGFVALPDELTDLDFKQSAEGQKILKEAEVAGVAARVQFLETLKQNETVSLQRDLDRSNLKYDARLEMSPEVITQLEELAGYKAKSKNKSAEKLERIKEIESLINEE